MKKFYKNNSPKYGYAFKNGLIPAGAIGEVEEAEVSPQLLKRGILVEVSKPSAAEVVVEVKGEQAPLQKPVVIPDPDAPPAPNADDEPGEDDIPWTVESAAEAIVKDETLLDVSSFTKSGVPELKAFNAAFEQEFTAKERDEIWAKVKELKADASNA